MQLQRVRFSTASDIIPESVQLIPGLPDDVALHCLLRLPVSCRAVCKRWNDVLGNKERFFSLRKQLDFKDPWLFVIANSYETRSKKTQCQVLDLTSMSWHTIPPMQSHSQHKVGDFVNGMRCVSIQHEDAVFVCGGWWCDLVSKFEIRKYRWTTVNRMNPTRSCHACGVINGMIYVAGGFDGNGNDLDSADILDPVKKTCLPIAKMGLRMLTFDSAVLDGKLLVTNSGLFQLPTSVTMVQVYDPITNNWDECRAVGLRQGWVGKSAVVYGHLIVLSYRKLKVYKPDNDSWEVVQGPPLPNLVSGPFVVNACDNDGILCVVGNNLDVAVGYISISTLDNKNQTASNFSVRWQQIPAPKGLLNLIPQTSQLLFA